MPKGIEHAYQRRIAAELIEGHAAKSGGAWATPITASALGTLTGAASKLTTGISPTDGARYADEVRRLQSQLYEAKARLDVANLHAEILRHERHELAERLDERSEEAPRLSARLKGVIKMLQDEENPRLDEAIWLLDKIAYAWDAERAPKVKEAKEPGEDYIPF